jgi:hypothetical protein
MTPPNFSADDWANFISVLALIFSLVSVFVAGRANGIASSAPWADVLMRHLTEEILNIDHDARLFRQLCTVPIKDATRKRKLIKTLQDYRDESARRLYVLSVLAPQTKKLTALKATLDRLDDSFFENEDLALSQDRAHAMLASYNESFSTYAKELRKCAFNVNSRSGLGDGWLGRLGKKDKVIVPASLSSKGDSAGADHKAARAG